MKKSLVPPTTQCIKVSSLRKSFPKEKNIDLEKWMEKTNTLYVGRRGRIFIGSGEDKQIFHYKDSKWHNPYKVGSEYSLKKSLKLYEKHVRESGLYDELEELSGKSLGCFCEQVEGGESCHAQVLVKLFNERFGKSKSKRERSCEEEYEKCKSKRGSTKVTRPKKKVEKPEKKVKIVKSPKTKDMPRIVIGQAARGVGYPKIDGFKVYPIHSRGAKPWRDLSPFFIGPVEFIDSDGDKAECPIFENYWQSAKAWKKVAKQNQKKPEWVWPAETHIGKDGEPNDKWYKWRDALAKHDKAVRRPNGKAIPEYAWWRDPKTKRYKKLGVVEAREKIYIPLLKKLYRAHPTYKKLLKDFKGGQDIILVEPDGPWHELYPNGLEVNLGMLKKMISKTSYKAEGHFEKYFPYGHGYVAAMCLFEDF
jgi:hypothetical protein